MTRTGAPTAAVTHAMVVEVAGADTRRRLVAGADTRAVARQVAAAGARAVARRAAAAVPGREAAWAAAPRLAVLVVAVWWALVVGRQVLAAGRWRAVAAVSRRAVSRAGRRRAAGRAAFRM
jgi:hypothetical protein